MPAQRTFDLTETLEQVNVPSFVLAASGRITWFNQSARRTFGDLVGKTATAVVAPEDAARVQRQFRRKLHGVPVTDYEVVVVTKDGKRQRAEISSVPIPDGDDCHAVFGVAIPRPPRVRRAHLSLTPRQAEVLRLLGAGASTNDIAESLHLSRETVRNHIRHVLRALGVHSRLEAVAVAHAEGLLERR